MNKPKSNEVEMMEVGDSRPQPNSEVIYRGMGRLELDASYDNRRAFPSFVALRAAWEGRSQRLLKNMGGARDLPYGPGSRQRLDYLACGIAARPTVAFIHGGYWQWDNKEDYAFVAEGLLEHGLNVAMIEYTRAPQAGVGDIIREVQAAMRWLTSNLPERFDCSTQIAVCGHSAGGHLAAIAQENEGLAGAMMISGIFDLAPIRLCYLNDALNLTEDDVGRYSPVHRIPGLSSSVVAVGSRELPALVGQSVDYSIYLRNQNREVHFSHVPEVDHFTILELLANPEGSICQSILQLFDKSPK